MTHDIVCMDCGSANVYLEARAVWNVVLQDWAFNMPYDFNAYCEDCDDETEIVEKDL